MHHFYLESFLRQLLAHSEVILIDHLNGNMNRLPRLLKLYAHLVNSVYDPLAPLRISRKLFRVYSHE